MDVCENSGFSPQIIHVYRVFHYFHHPFWGLKTPIFGVPPTLIISIYMFSPRVFGLFSTSWAQIFLLGSHGTNGMYIPTWMIDFYGFHVAKYTVRPMDPMGYDMFNFSIKHLGEKKVDRLLKVKLFTCKFDLLGVGFGILSLHVCSCHESPNDPSFLCIDDPYFDESLDLLSEGETADTASKLEDKQVRSRHLGQSYQPPSMRWRRFWEQKIHPKMLQKQLGRSIRCTASRNQWSDGKPQQ